MTTLLYLLEVKCVNFGSGFGHFGQWHGFGVGQPIIQ